MFKQLTEQHSKRRREEILASYSGYGETSSLYCVDTNIFTLATDWRYLKICGLSLSLILYLLKQFENNDSSYHRLKMLNMFFVDSIARPVNVHR